MLGHRLTEWCGQAPMLEEDMALANMALDLIGQARALRLCRRGRGRGPRRGPARLPARGREYRNLLLVEQPNGDFAVTIVRQFLYAAFMVPFWERLQALRDETLAAIAAKSVKEARYHLRHAAEWVIRLGDGTDESRDRAQAALDELWPWTGELFELDAAERALVEAGVAVDRAALKPAWDATVDRVLPRRRCRARPTAGCRPAAGAACTPSIWATSWPSCSTCSAPSGSDVVSVPPGTTAATPSTCAWRGPRAGAAEAGGRPRDPGADHRRPRRAARRARGRGRRRSRS